MSEFEAEMSINDAARQLKLSPKTVRMWGVHGIHVRGSEHIRLRTVRLGRRYFTRPEWVTDFLAALNPTEATATVA